MSARVCSSCKTENDGTQVYCAQCGCILPEARTEPGHAPAPARWTPPAVEDDSAAQGGFISKLWGMFVYLLLVAVGVIAVLAFMGPEEFPLPASPANPRSLVDRAIANSQVGPAIITQQAINDLIKTAPPIVWKMPVQGLPPAEYRITQVVLSKGKVACHANLSFMGYSLHFYESFTLTGKPTEWRLDPEVSGVGLLKMGWPALDLVTPLMAQCASSFTRDLAFVAGARLLDIRPGMIEFTAR